MSHPLHVLILEDQPDDAELVLRELRRAEFDPNWLRVETEADYLAQLDPTLDVILADYSLPSFNALQALRLLRDRGLDVPFIVVTGTIGEEAAAECIKQGATDYLLKDRLGRLGQAVSRALQEKAIRVEKQQAEVALRESQRTLSTLMSNLPGMAYRCRNDPDWTMEFVSEGCLDLTGYRPSALIGSREVSYADLIHPEDRAPVWIQVQAAVRENRPFQLLYRILTATREERWVWEQGRAILSSEGELLGLEGFITDITDRKMAEEALLGRTRQLEAIQAVTEEITRELDLSVVLNLITQRAVKLLGVGSGAVFLWSEATQRLIPKAWHGLGDWMPRMQLSLGEGVIGTVAQRRKGMLVNQYPSSDHSHPGFLARTNIAHALAEPLLYRDRLVGVIGIISQDPGRPFAERDPQLLTLFAAQAAIAIENARLYEELREAARQLEARVEERTRELREAMLRAEEASHAKSDFLANMSHELRTPLNSVIGFAGILLMQDVGPLNQRQERFLEHIHQGGKHLLELINDILDLSKVEAGKLTLHPEALPVAVTLEDCLVLTRSLGDKKSQTVTADIQADLPSLRADPVRFKQILFNLLSNAVKFTPESGTITVTARKVDQSTGQAVDSSRPVDQLTTRPIDKAGEWLEIAVTDTGIGIKAADLPRLFREFTQLEPAATKTHEGTGLGLVLTRRLVELHGGRVWAESEGEGRGSTFTVVLPFSGPGDQGTE